MAMSSPSVQTLIEAVRLRLWREQGLAVARRAAWASAVVMLLGVVVHLAAASVPVGAVLVLTGLLWISMLAWAGGRRPSDAASALWIDRRLGGASAFTTLLDASSATNRATNPQALRWLERWTAARVPDALRLLAAQQSSTRIVPALLSMAVCTALVLIVLMLPEAVPAFRGQAAASAPDNRAETPAPIAESPVATQLASDLSNALRSTEPQSEREQQAGGSGSTKGPAEPDDGTGAPTASSNATPGDAATARESRSGATGETKALAGSPRSAAAVSGREAGESTDARADVGVSPVPRGTMVVKRFGSKAPLTDERQADMANAASFDDGLAENGITTSRAALVAAAATPPPATDTARLSLAETHYVQAWMKASGRSR